jgi:hypothetical protein
VAFAAEGGEQWRQSLDGTAHFNDAINALALADGAVVAGGFLINTANSPTGIAVVFDGESGMQMHRQDVAGTGNFGQNAVVAVVTRGATAVVAGVMTNADTAQDMFMDAFDVLADRPLVAGR